MPSMEESRRQVEESLQHQNIFDHDDILASLQDEIDKHNAAQDGLREAMRRNKRSRDESRLKDRRAEKSAKFRFKSGVGPPRKSKHRSKRHEDGHRRHEERSKRENLSDEDRGAAHPFPREPADVDAPDPADAFRSSLFDALADDEGAHYWESVYSQPIHVYTRPTVHNEKGELEEMSDEQYAEYVKAKMWEKKHPDIVQARDKAKRKQREEEEEKTRRREEFVRRKERAAWERAERKGARRFTTDEEDEYEHTVPKTWNTFARGEASRERESQKEYDAAWSRYLVAWDKLKLDLLQQRAKPSPGSALAPAKCIPWPVLHGSTPVTRPNIEAFMHNCPAAENKLRVQLWKAERVRWHPDKIQQRFGGQVEEGTMRLVTEVFQVVDALYEEERRSN
ncbi:hypothetical protein Tdes44962_MAKER06917 [Teratosphaeria destructans]|uniref:NF-kappa-B inhibitor-like protein 1 n=1 Tax=Teratosphaeria destructans TaxID=418781 RepID=A0A9W7W6J2_9PEZI|nr:hypothetical protein Tdes44962_MAKER06917 [Teratosphaeria destructans]